MAIRSKKDTAETEYQEALKQSEERFRALIQYSADAIQLISAEEMSCIPVILSKTS